MLVKGTATLAHTQTVTPKCSTLNSYHPLFSNLAGLNEFKNIRIETVNVR